MPGSAEESTDSPAGAREWVSTRAARSRRWASDKARAIRGSLPRPLQHVWDLTRRTWQGSLEDRVGGLAAEIALFTLISLPSLMLVVLGSLGFVANTLGPAGEEELNRIVFDLPRGFLADRTYESYEGLASTVLAGGRADVISLGALLSLWTGSRATARALETISIAYDVEQPRPGWKRRLLAVALTVGGLLGAIALLPLLVLGPRVVEWVAPAAVASVTLDLLGVLYWPVLGAVAVAALATLYHVGFPWRTPWRRDVPGALFAMVLWLLVAAGLRAYLAVTIGRDAVYSQLGVPIAVVLWLYVSSIAVLVGAELNAEIERKWPTADR